MISSKNTASESLTHENRRRDYERQGLTWALSSTTGILTTRLLVAQTGPAITRTLLLLHISLALALHIYRHGVRIFQHVPQVSAQDWWLPFGLRSRPIKSIWIDWLCRLLYIAFTTISLICSYRAIAELQDLPVTILLMQVYALLWDLFMAVFGCMCAGAFGRPNSEEACLVAAMLLYQVCSVGGFAWLCVMYLRHHLAGVFAALASSFTAGAAQVLHHWIEEDIRGRTVDNTEIRAFDAIVLAMNASLIVAIGRVRFTAVFDLLDAVSTSCVLFMLNILACTAAIYAYGGVVRQLRTMMSLPYLSYTNLAIAVIWCAMLIFCEYVASGTSRMSVVEVIVCVVLMAGREPIEGSETALALVSDWIEERWPTSIL